MAKEKQAVDLHGCAYEPFPDFNEETIYLERVTCVDRPEAQKRMANEYGMEPSELPVEETYMRWAEGAGVTERSSGEFDAAWLECKADHPDAVPFWKADGNA